MGVPQCWGHTLFLLLCVTVIMPWGRANTICDEPCVEEKCPRLQYCTADIVKDHCGCCTVCSTDLYKPPGNSNFTQKGVACAKVECKKFQICMENMQGLPLCTCPNIFVCKNYRKQVCGIDDQTYESRCHMRVTACNKNKRIKVKHKGPCTLVYKNTGMMSDTLNRFVAGTGHFDEDIGSNPIDHITTGPDNINGKRNRVNKDKGRKSKRKKKRRNKKKKDKNIKKRKKRRNNRKRNKRGHRFLRGRQQRNRYFRRY